MSGHAWPDDAWIDGMVREGERRATGAMVEAIDTTLALIPESFHPLVRALVGAGIAQGQTAAFNVLHEQGWLRPELEQSS